MIGRLNIRRRLTKGSRFQSRKIFSLALSVSLNRRSRLATLRKLNCEFCNR